MPKGMLQAFLGLAPNSLADLSNCIFWNTEAADFIEILVRALKSLGTTEDPASHNSEMTPAAGPDLVRSCELGV